MHVEAALRAVEGEVLELTLQIGLHLEELEPEHLRVDGDRMIASTGSLRFVDEIVGLDGLLGDGVDGLLEDLALALLHGRMLARGDDAHTASVGGVPVGPVEVGEHEDVEQLGASSRRRR